MRRLLRKETMAEILFLNTINPTTQKLSDEEFLVDSLQNHLDNIIKNQKDEITQRRRILDRWKELNTEYLKGRKEFVKKYYTKKLKNKWIKIINEKSFDQYSIMLKRLDNFVKEN